MGKKLTSNFRMNIFLANWYFFSIFLVHKSFPPHWVHLQTGISTLNRWRLLSKAGLPHLVDVVSLKHSWPLPISVFLLFFAPIPAGFQAFEHQGDAVTSLFTSPSSTSLHSLPCTKLPVLFWDNPARTSVLLLLHLPEGRWGKNYN